MSTTPRVRSAIDDRPADLRSALAHCPDLATAFHHLYGVMWSEGIVDQPLKETVRMRNARVTDCGFCKNVRFAGAREAGLTEEQVAMIDDGFESSGLSERQKVALRFTDAYLRAPGEMPAEVMADMRERFTEPEVVEIGLALSLFLGMAKVLVSLGTEPVAMDVTVLPTPAAAGVRR
jgi:AhpD family alkylhydroperoxidase